jgi:hypothetical protein
MKKTSLLLVMGLAVLLASAVAPKANAGVVVGVRIGGPVYVPPVRAYGYVAPGYVAPGYVAPYVGPRAFVTVAPRRFYRRAYVAPVYRDRWYGRRAVVVHRDYRGFRR